MMDQDFADLRERLIFMLRLLTEAMEASQQALNMKPSLLLRQARAMLHEIDASPSTYLRPEEVN